MSPAHRLKLKYYSKRKMNLSTLFIQSAAKARATYEILNNELI